MVSGALQSLTEPLILVCAGAVVSYIVSYRCNEMQSGAFERHFLLVGRISNMVSE